MNELYLENSDASLFDGEYNTCESDEDQGGIRPYKFEAYLSDMPYPPI